MQAKKNPEEGYVHLCPASCRQDVEKCLVAACSSLGMTDRSLDGDKGNKRSSPSLTGRAAENYTPAHHTGVDLEGGVAVDTAGIYSAVDAVQRAAVAGSAEGPEGSDVVVVCKDCLQLVFELCLGKKASSRD